MNTNPASAGFLFACNFFAAAAPCPPARKRSDAQAGAATNADMPRIFGAASEARLKPAARRARTATPRRQRRRDEFTF
ncbi:hypothetical protein J5226_13565 [Lysobacter sp. K5869]|uniref:hypothetical protein n=1 Tax=Lysobacter sp. K5869 TaxID=2820808 RepID=UPI001C05F8FC|nr:hypothetical protein [Lysobacter sp. K5869]QWP74715.1 hypothetical protein J5226_13565 [Lysobacter sp. K5869]